jgi:hypothetical protein
MATREPFVIASGLPFPRLIHESRSAFPGEGESGRPSFVEPSIAVLDRISRRTGIAKGFQNMPENIQKCRFYTLLVCPYSLKAYC